MTALEETTSSAPASAREASVLKVHYHRWDGKYKRVTLWTWDTEHRRQPRNAEVPAAGKDDFGVYFLIDTTLYGAKHSSGGIGMIPRRNHSWNEKDGGDRTWHPHMGNEIWLVQGETEVYGEEPDISPRVNGAWLDGWNRVRALLSHPVEVESLNPVHYSVVRNAAENIQAIDVRPIESHDGEARLLCITLEKPLRSLTEWLELKVECFRTCRIRPGLIQHNPKEFGTDQPLGALYSPEATTFRVWSPGADSVAVLLYETASGRETPERFNLDRHDRGVWETTIDGDLEGRFYTLRVRQSWQKNAKEVVDPYAVNTTGNDGRARITDLRRTDPDGFREHSRPEFSGELTDAIISEISIRDISVHPSSGISAKGKFLGLAEKRTHLEGDDATATGLAHLKEMGFTHVQILPVQDFDNDETSPMYNWGYMTAFFNSPEGWYATNIRDTSRIREMKQMVQAIHEAGLGVIMDVVYNHTGVDNTLEDVAPDCYIRRRLDGSSWNGSGTGNEVASEHQMVRRFIVESCRFWIEEYMVDGFRFDLMGLTDLDTLRLIRDEVRVVCPNALLYGEPWTGEVSGIEHVTDKKRIAGSGIGAFNDHFRNAIKGEPDGSAAAYVQSATHRAEVIKGIEGSIHDWAKNPSDTINYVTCHDNLTLWDKIEASTDAPEEQRRRMHALSMAILAVSQGAMFLHGGCEFLRSKGGNHNSYCAGDAVNRIAWPEKVRHRDINDFTLGLIALRRAHPVFRLRTAKDVGGRLHFIDLDAACGECIAFTLSGENLDGESWNRAAVFINPHGVEHAFDNPLSDEARPFIRGLSAGTEPVSEAPGRRLAVAPRSLLLIAE